MNWNGLFVFAPSCLRWIITFAVLIALTASGRSEEPRPDAADSTATNWAIIATSENAGPIADLLTAELSEWDNVQLVERDQIRRVLGELNLNASGLVDAEHRIRFVQLTGADALVLIDAPETGARMAGAPDTGAVEARAEATAENSELKSGRIRLVDARTSVRLVDNVLPATDLESQLASVMAELRDARDTLSIPANQLRLIGVISIKSEEPGEQLKPFCNTLTKLVEFQLHRMPPLVVVERTDLIRLVDEKNVSGKEMDLFSAARLLETGVHRATDGKGMVVTCRLLSPRGEPRETIRLAVASSDIRVVRDEIIRAVTARLGDAQAVNRPRVDPAIEADVFDRRRKWLHSAYRFADAAEMAEVAYALDPTIDRLETALQEYRLLRHTYSNRGQKIPAMEGYDRLLADYNQRTLRPKLREGQDAISAIRAYAHRPLRRGTDSDHRKREQHRLGALGLFEQRLEQASDDPARRFAILLEKLSLAHVLAASNQEFVEQLPKSIDELIATRKEAGISESVSEKSYERFVMWVIPLVTRIEYLLRSESALPHGESVRENWYDYLNHQQELAIRTANLIRLSQQRVDPRSPLQSEQRDTAALELVELMREWEPASGNVRTIFEMKFRMSAFSQINRSGFRTEYLDIILKRAQGRDGAIEVMRDAAHVRSILAATPKSEQLEIAAQINDTLDRMSDADQTTVEPLRRQVEDQLVRSRLIKPESPEHSLKHDVGPWQSYSIRAIDLVDPDPEHNQMLAMYVDRREDAKRRGGELFQVWSRRGGRGVTLERVDLATGKLTRVGPVIPGYPRSFRGVPIAVSPKAVFVATDAPGFSMIQGDAIRTYTEEDGAPSNDVWRMAWYGDRLYIAYADALASFDPVSSKFTLLASSMSVEPRNLIDGRGSFFVRYLIPDEANECLWLGIQDNAVPRDRNGFWRFEPETNVYTKISGSHVVPVWTADGFLLHRSATTPWAHVDRQTGELTELDNYGCWTNPSVAWQQFVMLGDHILTSRCLLLTPDGQSHQASKMSKWPHLQATGEGCITQFDEKTNRLWYLQRKENQLSR